MSSKRERECEGLLLDQNIKTNKKFDPVDSSVIFTKCCQKSLPQKLWSSKASTSATPAAATIAATWKKDLYLYLS